ncbi:MAG: BPTI/Kunitz-type proteinase inhibitor domain-containing protein [bacterium]
MKKLTIISVLLCCLICITFATAAIITINLDSVPSDLQCDTDCLCNQVWFVSDVVLSVMSTTTSDGCGLNDCDWQPGIGYFSRDKGIALSPGRLVADFSAINDPIATVRVELDDYCSPPTGCSSASIFNGSTLVETRSSVQEGPANGPGFFEFNTANKIVDRLIITSCNGHVGAIKIITTTSTNPCQMPIDPGPCYAYIVRYAFNNKTGRCEQFIYGGCGGNQNNFTTLEECRQSCGGTATTYSTCSGMTGCGTTYSTCTGVGCGGTTYSTCTGTIGCGTTSSTCTGLGCGGTTSSTCGLFGCGSTLSTCSGFGCGGTTYSTCTGTIGCGTTSSTCGLFGCGSTLSTCSGFGCGGTTYSTCTGLGCGGTTYSTCGIFGCGSTLSTCSGLGCGGTTYSTCTGFGCGSTLSTCSGFGCGGTTYSTCTGYGCGSTTYSTCGLFGCGTTLATCTGFGCGGTMSTCGLSCAATLSTCSSGCGYTYDWLSYSTGTYGSSQAPSAPPAY